MSSKFKGILDRAKERDTEPQSELPEVAAPPSPAPMVSPVTKKRGRPSGKRSDDDYVQTTAYIHKDRHKNVKIALLKLGNGQDFSDLVDDLLAEWLKKNG
jgi:hypothetical protein